MKDRLQSAIRFAIACIVVPLIAVTWFVVAFALWSYVRWRSGCDAWDDNQSD